MTQTDTELDPFPGWAADDARPEVTAHQVQAAAEDAGDFATVELLGERFRLAEGVALMPLMKFALAARGGLNTDDMAGLVALYDVIRDCVHRPVLTEPDTIPGDDGQPVPNPRAGQPQRDPDTGALVHDEREWLRFETHATEARADDEDLNDFLQKAIEAISARPRKRRGNSSGSSPATSEKSRAISSSPVIPVPPGGRMPPGAEELTTVADVARSTG
jgi:hypothetical protein